MDAVGVVALAAVVFVVPSLAWLLLLTDRGRLGEPRPDEVDQFHGGVSVRAPQVGALR